MPSNFPTATTEASGQAHTPGPWRLFMTTDGRKLIGIGELNGDGVADHGFGTWRSGEEQLANARLIAAAPELLEALKECAEALDCERSRHATHLGREPEDIGARSALKAADAAISKAEGAA